MEPWRDRLSGSPSRASPFANRSCAASFARSWELRRRPSAFEMERNGRISRRSRTIAEPNSGEGRFVRFPIRQGFVGPIRRHGRARREPSHFHWLAPPLTIGGDLQSDRMSAFKPNLRNWRDDMRRLSIISSKMN